MEKDNQNSYVVDFFKNLEISQSKISEDLGVSQPYVSALVNGKKNIGKKMAKKIASLYGADESMLLLGKGEILKTQAYRDEVTPIPYENYMEIEYADLSTAAGLLGVENPATLPKTKKRLLPKEFEKGNYLVVKVDGDSMDNGTSISIPDGTEILIREYPIKLDKERLPIRGNLFVVVTSTGTVFKQIIAQNMEERYITCHSYNTMFEDYNIPFEEILQIFLYRKVVSSRPTIPEF